MPDMKKSEYGDDAGDDALAESLEAVRRDDEEPEVPPRVKAFVMRTWDTQLRSEPRRLSACGARFGSARWPPARC